jgi:plastocyanin
MATALVRLIFNQWVLAVMLSSLHWTLQAASLTVEVINKDGKAINNVVVTLTYPDVKVASSQTSAWAIEQEKMRFIPEMSLIQRGAIVKFTNKDKWDHHVHVSSLMNSNSNFTPLEFRLNGADAKTNTVHQMKFEAVGPYLLGCHIHGSMRGFVYVTDTPYAMLSNKDGQVVWSNLPEGLALLKIWHPYQLLETATQSVNIKGDVKQPIQLYVVDKKRF